MDQQMYEIACEAIRQDCTIIGMLSDGKGGFCAVGGLYALIDPDWACGAPAQSGDIYGLINQVFGIYSGEMTTVNDRCPTTRGRRIQVRKELKRQLEAS